MTDEKSYDTKRTTVMMAVEHLQNSLQGRGEEYAESFPSKPSERHPSGTLFPGPDGGSVRDISQAYGRVSFTPTALGVKMNVSGDDPLPCKLRIRGGLYYPVVPDHDEALRWMEDYAGSARRLRLPLKYRRVDLDASAETEIPLAVQGTFRVYEDATDVLREALDAAERRALGDPDLAMVGARGGGSYTVGCTREEVEDPDRYAELFREARPAEPRWDGEVHFRVVHEGEDRFLEVLVHNASPDQSSRYEPAFIGVHMQIEAPVSRVRRFQLREIESRDYRYDSTTWATGRNTYAEGRLEEGIVVVETESVPVRVQKRLRQRTWEGASGEIDTRFDRMKQDPVTTLDDILVAMERYLEGWEAKAVSVPAAEREPDQVTAGKRDYRREIERFSAGLARMKADPAVLDAFKLMNESFADRFRRLRPSGDAGWRLFQLVFVVSEIDDLVRRAGEEAPDRGPDPTILWFPTGGGKTEAYLGLVVWHAFWDRLRGKPYGTTAFAKFPLRMLSLQQFSRVVAVMEHADDVRRNAPVLEGRRGDPFSVGYYAGAGNSENLIDWPVSPDGAKRSAVANWITKKLGRKEEREKYERQHRKVTECPSCSGDIRTRFDENKPGFSHTCMSCDRRLNLHLSDTEVLRWLPTLVIATVDKLARFASEHWGRSLFGDAAARCTDHGYLLVRPDDSGHCPVMDCKNHLEDPPENVDPVPALLIQDELHVLSESLGAMASHYETAINATMRRKPGSGPWKVVGSTATIEGYKSLVRHLYNYGDCHRFPASGPDGEESFYVQNSDEDQRFVVGVRTHGMSHVDATMKVFLEYHKVMAPVFDRDNCDTDSHPLPDHLGGLGEQDLDDLASWYRTVVCYGINKNEVSQVARSFAGQLNAHCHRDGLPLFQDDRVDLLTGDTSIERLQDWLNSVERGKDPYRQAAAVTSLFALGIDIPYLNMIAFRGMPHGMAEYIQAMSRVGRKDGVPSVVVNVYNPNRERDASYFETHSKYLEFANVLIRHVPTTRFSKHALELTLPGIFLHQVNYHNPVREIWKRQSVAGAGKEIRDDEARYIRDVKTALGVEDAPEGDEGSSLVLRQKQHIDAIMSRIRSDLLRKTPGVNPMQEAAKARLGVPTSLRTTDETIRVYSRGVVGGDE